MGIDLVSLGFLYCKEEAGEMSSCIYGMGRVKWEKNEGEWPL